jgi:hypothetical protein
MGKKAKGLELNEGKNFIIFDDTKEDYSAMPRQQRRLRERLHKKSQEAEAKKFLKAQKFQT